MSACDLDLKKNLVVNCDIALAKGIGETIYTGRIRDIDTVTYDSTNKKIITSIVMKTGKKLNRWIGINYSNGAGFGFAAGEFGNNIPHNLRYILYSKDAGDRAEVDSIAQINDMFAVVVNNGNPVQYDVYGWRTGLRMSNMASDVNDESLKGAINMEFSAPDEKLTPYTIKHMTSGGSPVDDTATFVDGLARTLT